MIRSFRARLTLWYLALFSLLFLIFSWFLHGVLWRGLERRLGESLTVEANTAAAMLADEFVEEHGDPLASTREALANLRPGRSTVAFVTGDRLLGSSAPLPPDEVADMVRGAGAKAGARPIAALPILALPHAGNHGARAAVARVTLGGRQFLIFAVQPI